MRRAAWMLAGALVALTVGQAGGCGQVCVSRSQLKSGVFGGYVAEFTTANYSVIIDPSLTQVDEAFDVDGKHWQRSYRVVSIEHVDDKHQSAN